MYYNNSQPYTSTVGKEELGILRSVILLLAWFSVALFASQPTYIGTPVLVWLLWYAL